MGRSLSARIIAGVLCLLVIVSIANFSVALYVGGRLAEGASGLIETMQAGLSEKDKAVGETIAATLALETELLRVRHDAEASQARLAAERERGFLAGKRNGLATSAVTRIRASMMSGEASALTELFDELLEDPNIVSIDLWRPDGVKALSDNATIDAVNRLVGATAFQRRAASKRVAIEGARADALNKAVAKSDEDVTLDASIEVDGADTPIVYSYHVLQNSEECQGCHGETAAPRGVLEIAISRADLLWLQAASEARLAELDAAQRAEAATMEHAARARVADSKARSAELADLVAKGRADLAAVEADSHWLLALVIAVVLIGAVLAMTVILRRALSAPLTTMTEVMRQLAGGNLTTEIPARERDDEIGQMADAVRVFKDGMVHAAAQDGEQRRAQEEKERRRVRVEELTGQFERQVSGVMHAVREATAQMARLSGDMTQTAGHTNARAAEVAEVTEDVATNVDTVATAARELSASIQEISGQIAQSSEEAQSAAREADMTNQRVRGLAESAERIGEVMTLIQSIAEQTNLLALNATIEAARAGEAGRGFAVVANEVKSLATQTANATDDISNHISQIQSATNETVEAIQVIADTIASMSRSTTVIASAVEEQGAATSEIARSVDQTSSATRAVKETIAEVSEATARTGTVAHSVSDAAGHLAAQSDLLNKHVATFLAGIKAV